MCGITGFVGFGKKHYPIETIVKKMSNSITHRGPDESGIWIDRNVQIALAHQRLSILDLSSAGSQPMQSVSGRYVAIYNGEIYNHQFLRKKIDQSSKSIKWVGSSDTETLLYAIDFWGIEKAIAMIEGMFAIAVWDKKLNTLYLIRDRLGEKPLYYGLQTDTFMFASELKALKCHPSFKGSIERDSILLQMKYGYIPAPNSIYKGIFKLEPGSICKVSFNNDGVCQDIQNTSYWTAEELLQKSLSNQYSGDFHSAVTKLEEVLKKSVKSQMVSDVPIGAFLSGGIDSSLIVAIMQDLSISPVKTFTIGFQEDKFNEANHAKKVSQILGTDHTEYYVLSSEALDIIPKLPRIYDEPFSDSSQIPTFLVSNLAKSQVTVSLSGDGGDELFGGYNRHVFSKKWGNTLFHTPFFIRNLIGKLLLGIKPMHLDDLEMSKINQFLDKKIFNNLSNIVDKTGKALCSKNVDDLYERFNSHWYDLSFIKKSTEFVSFKPNDLNLKNSDIATQMMLSDLTNYLPGDILTKVDRAAMANSLETRIPMLDINVIEFSMSLPINFKIKGSNGKFILKELLNKFLPKNLYDRPKQGFALPIESWLKGPLYDWAENLLDPRKLNEDGYFDSMIIQQKWHEHKNGIHNWQTELWDVLMFQAWLEDQK